MNTKNIHVYAFTGIERSGKTTCCEYLSGEVSQEYLQYCNPWLFIYSVIWNKNYNELCEILTEDFGKADNYENQELAFNNDVEKIPNVEISENLMQIKNILKNILGYINLTWNFRVPAPGKILNLSSALKEICVCISGNCFEKLNGELGPRDIPSMNYPKITIRELLQKIGTEGFRNNINANIWINLLINRIIKLQYSKYFISDLRFENEYIELKKRFTFHGFLIYRDPRELQLTKEVKQRHISSWSYLTFTSNSDFIKIKNFGTLQDLYEKLQQLTN